jgi:hypothetical protein
MDFVFFTECFHCFSKTGPPRLPGLQAHHNRAVPARFANRRAPKISFQLTRPLKKLFGMAFGVA